MRGNASWTRRRLRRRSHWRHTHPDFADPPQQPLEGKSYFQSRLTVQEFHPEWVKSVDMLLKVLTREIGVPFHHVDDHGPPCLDVPWLRLLELDEASNDIRAKPAIAIRLVKEPGMGKNCIRNQCRLSIGSTSPSFIAFIVVHPHQDVNVRSCAATFLLQ